MAKTGVTVYGKDGQSAVSLTTKNENGKDTATLAFAKNENGTGVITGLADLTDGSMLPVPLIKSMWTIKCNPLMAIARLITMWTEKSGERARR